MRRRRDLRLIFVAGTAGLAGLASVAAGCSRSSGDSAAIAPCASPTTVMSNDYDSYDSPRTDPSGPLNQIEFTSDGSPVSAFTYISQTGFLNFPKSFTRYDVAVRPADQPGATPVWTGRITEGERAEIELPPGRYVAAATSESNSYPELMGLAWCKPGSVTDSSVLIYPDDGPRPTTPYTTGTDVTGRAITDPHGSSTTDVAGPGTTR